MFKLGSVEDKTINGNSSSFSKSSYLVNVRSLEDMECGESGEVYGFISDKFDSLKLRDLGIWKGKKLKKLRVAPFDGSVEVDVEGIKLTLRKDVARCIFVKISDLK
ncbi:MAG: FeoA family protein [Brevinematia bacterium]